MGESSGKPRDEPVRTKSLFGKPSGDSVVKMEITVQVSSTCEEVGGTHAMIRATESARCSGSKAPREGNHARGGASRTKSSQGNGR